MIKTTHSNEDWKKKLSPHEYHVLREKGTEPAFTGEYWASKDKGMFHCRACGAELFSSDTKFDSGTGWPSFTDPANQENVELTEDLSYGRRRTEVTCRHCGSHLGHVFDDGPGPSGKRFCINSCSLKLENL